MPYAPRRQPSRLRALLARWAVWVGSAFLTCGMALACAPAGGARPPTVGEGVACSAAGLEAFAACQQAGEPSPACALATARTLEVCAPLAP